MLLDDAEEKLIRSVALQNAKAILLARERAEREVVDAKQRITSILESITDGFFALDKDWRFTYVNRRGEEILRPLKKSRETLIGKSIWEEFPEIFDSDIGQNYRHAARDQVTVDFEANFSPLNRWFEVRVYPGTEGLSVYFHDITQRRKVAEALRESDQRLRAIFHQATVGMAVASLEGRFEQVNARFCEILGYSSEELLRKNMFALTYPDDRPKTEDNVRRLVAGQIEEYVHEKRYIRKDAEIVWGLTSVTLLKDSLGQPEKLIGVVEDVNERKQVEEIRSRLAAVVESSDDAIITMGLDTIITTWNKGAERMFGYAAAEAIGKSVTMLLPVRCEDDESRIIQTLLKGERIDHYETLRLRKDGMVLNVALTVSPIYDSNGRIAGVSKISRNITEQKKQQEAINRSQEELRAMADSIPQLAWMANPDGHIFWYNRRWFEYTGTTLKEMEGWGWQSVHDPKMLPKVLVRWTESIRTGEPFEMEFPLRGADGVYRWFLTRVQPVRDGEGRVLRWFGTNTDVDSVKRAKDALNEETRILELLNDTGRTIASQLDLQIAVQTVTDSATALTGAKFGAFFYNVIDQEGESFLLFTLAGASREAFETFGYPRATPLFGPTFRGEPPIRSDDITKDPRYGKMPPHYGMPKGHLSVRSYLAVPVVSRTGEVIGGLFFGHPEVGVFTERSQKLIVGMAAQAAIAIDNARLYEGAQREIAERKRVEAALLDAQIELRQHAEKLEVKVSERTARLRETIQELEAFSYSISHDMRSPLRAMQGYSDVLLQDYKGKLDETGEDYLLRIARAASRMDLLIQDVLAYSRVAKGEIQLRVINVENVVRDVIQNYPALQEDRASVTVFTPLPDVLGHEAYLTQIVSNLLSNGVKFVAPGTKPSVKVRSNVEGDMVRISFEDNGIGIAPEHQEGIFQIFGRVYSEKKFEGTGIGLAIVKKAAERMGGSVGLTSEFGHGSVFFVFLKRAI